MSIPTTRVAVKMTTAASAPLNQMEHAGVAPLILNSDQRHGLCSGSPARQHLPELNDVLMADKADVTYRAVLTGARQ